MAQQILMIALSPTMEEGQILEWKKKEGEQVAEGDVLCEVETDKASMEYESQHAGVLLKIIKKEGELASIGEMIGVIGAAGEDVEKFLKEISPHAEAAKKTNPLVLAASEASKSQAPQETQRIKVSPLAKKLAEEKGLDLTRIEGTGPNHRIIKRDIDALVQSSPVNSIATTSHTKQDTLIHLSKKRQIIAKRLSESKSTIPHYYLTTSITMDKVLEAREALNKARTERIGLNAFLMKFLAQALSKHPLLNSSLEHETLRLFGSIDIGVAVAQEDGLITPIVRNCHEKGIIHIEEELKALIDKARKGKLRPEEFQGATFTLSNLGSFGIESFVSIINPPCSAILAVGAVTREQIVAEGDALEIHSRMKVTLSCDHRVVDGSVAAAFLRDFKGFIEEPIQVLY